MKERKYKEDYGFESYIDDRGREKRRAVYRGEWFSMDAQDGGGFRRWCLLTMAVFAVMYLAYLKLGSPSANCMYVLPISACALIPLVYWITGLFSMWRAPSKMTRLQRETGVGRVLRASVGCASLMGMACLGDLVFILFSLRQNWMQELSGFMLLACAAFAGISCFKRAWQAYNRMKKVSGGGGEAA